jgi:hypothetical protein
VEAVRHVLTGRVLSGVAVAAGALAVLVLAAPPGPASVVAIGEPSTYTGPALRDDRDRALPACPAPAAVRAATVDAAARKTALLFARAWTTGDVDSLVGLADSGFTHHAASLQLGGSLGMRPRIAVSGMVDDELAAAVAARCGVEALSLMRIAAVRARTPGAAPVHLYTVWRVGSSRVWAVR